MNSSSTERLADIRKLLAEHPRGLSINEISSRLQRHRNSVSRDLHALSLSGQVIQHAFGTTRVYSLAQRTPITRVLQYTSDMVLILDKTGVIVAANNLLLTFLSCGLDALEGMSIHTKSHPLLAAVSSHVKGDLPQDTLSSTRLTITNENGACHLNVKKVPTVFENGTSGFVFIIEDVTEETRFRDALKTSEAQYRSIVDSLVEMVIRFLPDGSLIFANQAFSSYFTLPSRNTPEHSFFSLVYLGDRDALHSHLEALSPEQPLATISLRVVPASGVPAWNTWTIHGIYDKDARVLAYQGIGRDITLDIEAKERENAYTRELAFLTSKSQEFLKVDPGVDIYQVIARHFGEMIPGATIGVYSIHSPGWTFTLKALVGSPTDGEGDGFHEHGVVNLTCSLPGGEEEASEIREALLSGSLIDTGGFLSRCIFKQVPDGGYEQVMAGIEEMDTCSAGLVWKGSLFGAVDIFTKRGGGPFDRLCVGAYLNVASLALQRWASEKALMISEERFARIATTNPHPISIIDQSGHYTYLSPRFTELFGYRLADIPTGKEWFIHAFPDLAEQKLARDTWKRDLAESLPGEIRSRQFRVRCKDGLFKEISFLPVSMSDGQQLVVYEDITPRMEAIQTRNLLFDIFRSSHDGIFSATIDGRILSWNPAAERIYGYSADEVEGRDVAMLEPHFLRGEIAAILERIRKGEHIANFETQRVRKDGKLIDVSLTISPVYQEGGHILGASTIIRDITTRKSEERLRHAERRYQDMVDNINVGVYRSTGDPEGRFIWGNTSLLRILGYESLDDLQEVVVSDIFARTGGRADLLAELRQKGFVKNREIVLRRTDGTVVHVLVTALATFSHDGSISHINGIVEDITGQRLLEERVAQLTGEKRGI
ncbi:MAG: PAS domain S-box protein [Methanolinea sp.]|nr:PAS domain S-box protein [Methanolinea sp.]